MLQDIASAMKAKIVLINHKIFQLLYLLNSFFYYRDSLALEVLNHQPVEDLQVDLFAAVLEM